MKTFSHLQLGASDSFDGNQTKLWLTLTDCPPLSHSISFNALEGSVVLRRRLDRKTKKLKNVMDGVLV